MSKLQVPTDAVEYVVMIPNYWGRGATLAEAKKEAKRQGYGASIAHHIVYCFYHADQFHSIDDRGHVKWSKTPEGGKEPTVWEVKSGHVKHLA